MFKKILCIWSSYHDWEMSRDICYYYPMNQIEYENDPIKERTMELSEFQDGMEDIGTRETEWEVFEERVAQLTEKLIYEANPNQISGSREPSAPKSDTPALQDHEECKDVQKQCLPHLSYLRR